jgi:hypothetical protein
MSFPRVFYMGAGGVDNLRRYAERLCFGWAEQPDHAVDILFQNSILGSITPDGVVLVDPDTIPPEHRKRLIDYCSKLQTENPIPV